MTTAQFECCLCGGVSEQTVIKSTSSFGAPDLDTRPPELQRSTIYNWVQRCPSCGYCSSDLSKGSDDLSEIVQSKEYQSIIKNKEVSEIAGSFLAMSFQKEFMEKYADSAWSVIHAAWICDDEENCLKAKELRIKAINLIEKAKEHTQKLADQAGASEAITIDLMRRCGMFQEALDLAELIKNGDDIEEVILRVISYEISLIKLRDIDVHTVSEALGEIN